MKKLVKKKNFCTCSNISMTIPHWPTVNDSNSRKKIWKGCKDSRKENPLGESNRNTARMVANNSPRISEFSAEFSKDSNKIRKAPGFRISSVKNILNQKKKKKKLPGPGEGVLGRKVREGDCRGPTGLVPTNKRW